MVWSCAGVHGNGHLHLYNGSINVENCIEILEKNMVTSRHYLFREVTFLSWESELQKKWVWVLDWPWLFGFFLNVRPEMREIDLNKIIDDNENKHEILLVHNVYN